MSKCRHLKNWPVKGRCGRCLLEVMWIIASLTFSMVYLPPPLSLCQSLVNTDSVWQVGRRGCWVLLETIFYMSLTLCIWPYSKPTRHMDRHLPQSPFAGPFFRWRHFALLSIRLIFLRLPRCALFSDSVLFTQQITCETLTPLSSNF